MQKVGDVAQAQGEASPHVRYHHGLNLPNYGNNVDTIIIRGGKTMLFKDVETIIYACIYLNI